MRVTKITGPAGCGKTVALRAIEECNDNVIWVGSGSRRAALAGLLERNRVGSVFLADDATPETIAILEASDNPGTAYVVIPA